MSWFVNKFRLTKYEHIVVEMRTVRARDKVLRFKNVPPVVEQTSSTFNLTVLYLREKLYLPSSLFCKRHDIKSSVCCKGYGVLMTRCASDP